MEKKIVLIDADGTLFTHEFPAIGKDIGAAPVLRELVSAGHQLILWTMRSDKHDNTGYSIEVPEIHNGNYLSEAVKWFEDRNIPLYGINTNPSQASWTSSPKAYGTLCIDDINLGARLSKIAHMRPFIDWGQTYNELCDAGVLSFKASVIREVELERSAMLRSYM